MTFAHRIVVLFGLLASTAAADPACRPSARLSGDPASISGLEILLRDRGLEVSTAPSTAAAFTGTCRAVEAHIATVDGGLVVSTRDADGRRAQRRAEDIAAAATLIESWARADLVDPLLASRTGLQPTLDASSPANVVPITVTRFVVAVGVDTAVSGDGAMWAGGRLQGCAMLGNLCIGAAVRYATDLERTGDTRELGTARTTTSVSLTAERPFVRGRLRVAPGAGIGLAAVAARRDAEGEREDTTALHVTGGLGAAVRLTPSLSLRLDLTAQYAPLARARLGESDGVDRQLAALPAWQTWLGLAIAYGGM